MHAAQRYSLGDWAAAVLLFCVGLYLDKARPFEQYIGNRLADPSISYPHTPPEKQQVTANQLWCIALVFPACGIGATQLLLRRRRSSDLNQALLALARSIELQGLDDPMRRRMLGAGERRRLPRCATPWPEA